MRFFAVLVAICALPQVALAETRDCKTIADPTLRLLCYDKINPPTASYQVPLPKPSRPAPRVSGSTGHVNSMNEDDDAQINTTMHNICRGC